MTLDFAQRLALFVSRIDRPNTQVLLAGLSRKHRGRALDFANQALNWNHATRQRQVALTFGKHPAAENRVKKLLADASPALRAAIFRRLAGWHLSLFPNLRRKTRDLAPSPAMDALAVRLIHQATRQSVQPDPQRKPIAV